MSIGRRASELEELIVEGVKAWTEGRRLLIVDKARYLLGRRRRKV